MRSGVLPTFQSLGSPLSYNAAGQPQIDQYGRAITGSASVFVAGTSAEAQAGPQEGWQLESSDPWIHVPVSASRSSVSQVITVDPNTSGAPRSGFLRLTGVNGLFVYPQASLLVVNQS